MTYTTVTLRAGLALCLLLLTGLARAQEAPLRFVSEFIRELGAFQDLGLRGKREIDEDGGDANRRLMTAIRSSTRWQLELRTCLNTLQQIRLAESHEKTSALLSQMHEQRLQAHQDLIDLSSNFIGGPKPDVDYGQLAANLPKITAYLESLDKSLLQFTPLAFATLVDTKRTDANGHVNRLVISRLEKNRLLRDLQTSFGSSLDKKATQQAYVQAAASVMRSYLNKWKSADEP